MTDAEMQEVQKKLEFMRANGILKMGDLEITPAPPKIAPVDTDALEEMQRALSAKLNERCACGCLLSEHNEMGCVGAGCSPEACQREARELPEMDRR